MGGDALTAHPRVDCATGNALFLFMLILVLMQMIKKTTIAKTQELLPASSCCSKLVLWAGCLAALGVAVVHAHPLRNLLCYAMWKRQQHCARTMMPCLSACIDLCSLSSSITCCDASAVLL